jgi:hypothetical protein
LIRRWPASIAAIRAARVTAAFCWGLALALSFCRLALSLAFASRVANPSRPVCRRCLARLTACRCRNVVRAGFGFRPVVPVLANRPLASLT